MPTVTRIQVRCSGCNRRLADLVNCIAVGLAIVELKCSRCGKAHRELAGPPAFPAVPPADFEALTERNARDMSLD